MKPADVKLLLDAITESKRRAWNDEERGTLRRAKVAVFHGRWLDAKDAWIIQDMYRKSQSGRRA